jgi:hypothetical protein
LAPTVAARRARRASRHRRRHGVDARGCGRSGHRRDVGARPERLPDEQSLKTAPIADLAPPARTQIVDFEVLSGPINAQTQTFTLKVRVGSICSVNIKGASVYVTAVPYNQSAFRQKSSPGTTGPQPLYSAGTRTSPRAASSSS